MPKKQYFIVSAQKGKRKRSLLFVTISKAPLAQLKRTATIQKIKINTIKPISATEGRAKAKKLLGAGRIVTATRSKTFRGLVISGRKLK